MESIGRYPDEEPPEAVAALAEQVDKDGGHVLAVYQEPVGDRWQIFVLLPRERVEPTPYQRDLSPTHSKRLTDVVKRIDRFVDPIVVVSPKPGVYWTPNGHHRLTALEKLKAKLVPAILIPEAEVAYQILALNTEKAHNLKEKSLEVIRMYRGLMEEYPKSSEEDFSFQFEAPHFITLGLLYEENKRFAGGAFAPILKRVDKFLKGKLPDTIDDRKERAEKVKAADEALGKAVAELKKRGINHPYVKQYVLARTSPLNRQRKTLPSFDQTFSRLVSAIKEFDLSKVRYQDVQRAATFSPPASD
jgi:ParB family transcriptional regulator, chromosome partitioning protein